MRSFKGFYKEAVAQIEIPDITVDTVLDEVRHKNSLAAGRRRQFRVAAAAACLFLLCGAGTAAAVSYVNSVIKVNEYGFQTADEETARRNEGLAVDVTAGGLYGDDALPIMSSDEGGKAVESYEYEEAGQTAYDSLEELKAANPELALALPETSCLGEQISKESYTLVGEDWLIVRVQARDKTFMLNQWDYNGTSGHASSMAYPSGVCNEREYTTEQGYTWKVIDSVREEGEVLGIHAAVAVAGYELVADFYGYTEQEARDILEQMDLHVFY